MTTDPVHVTREGVSVVLTPSLSDSPVLAYWGEALGDLSPDELAGLVALQAAVPLHSSHDVPRRRGVVAETVSGAFGLPGLEGFRPSRSTPTWAPRLRAWTWDVDDAGPDARVALSARDDEAGWDVLVEIELTRDGLLRARTTVTNAGGDALEVSAVRTAVPVPPHATELLDLSGHWSRERHPQRGPWRMGTHLRESRHGRTGHDAATVLAAGSPGFGHRSGEVWMVHLAHSGDSVLFADRTPDGDCVLGGGALLGPGEVTLAPGETLVGPWLVGAYGSAGLDPASHRVHDWVRRHSPRVRRPRRVLVNTWEATYFDHDLDGLTALADAAAAVGVERFVLDDGWFLGRRDDLAGLGDWTVDPKVWPDGLGPLFDHVRGRGLDIGLWVEPEMVNVDSDLARAHPDWILRGRDTLPDEWRHEQVLDLQVDGARQHVLDSLSALVDEHAIDFLKWDHNRDVVDAAHDGRPAVLRQTAAALGIMDELRARFPDLEIESCASGGGRIDLEVLTRTDRVWPSDTIDALERQTIQTWTSLIVPPEMLGTHVGSPVAHTTGRTHQLSYRAATALIGHLGIEWDVRDVSADERDQLGWWIDLHRTMRPAIAEGRLVHGDHPDPAVVITGVVEPDAARGWFVVATTDSTSTRSPTAVRLPGLDPDRAYRLTRLAPPGEQVSGDPAHRSSGLDHEPVTTGRVLDAVGVRLHAMRPETAEVIRAEAVDARA